MGRVLIILLLVSISIVSNCYAKLDNIESSDLNYMMNLKTKECSPFPDEYRDEAIKTSTIRESNKKYIEEGWYILEVEARTIFLFKTLEMCERTKEVM